MIKTDEKLMARLEEYFSKSITAEELANDIRQHLFYILLEIAKNYDYEENELLNNNLHGNIWNLFEFAEIIDPKYFYKVG